MRDYGIVSPRFWIGETGRKLRKMPDAQRIALYLMTAPMAEMTGVFYCPVATILNDVGAPCEGLASAYEGASEGLARGDAPPSEGHQRGIEGVKRALKALQELDFCFYDFESEFVFVKEMACWQIAEKLKPSDNRVKGIRRAVENFPKPMRTRFLARYNEDFSLGFEEKTEAEKASPLEAPSEPHRSQEQEQEQEQKHIRAPASSKKPTAITHTFDLQELPEDWKQYCLDRRPDLDPHLTFVDFKGWWTTGKGSGTRRSDKSWTSTWQTWVRNQKEGRQQQAAAPKRSIFAATPETTCMKPIDRHAQARDDAPDPRELFGGLI